MSKKASTKECDKCKEQISLYAFNRHYKACKGFGKRKPNRIPENGKFICLFCLAEFTTASGCGRHEAYCELNPKKKIPNAKTGKFGNQYTKAKELGLPKPQITEETLLKFKEKAATGCFKWDDERKKKHSVIMSNTVAKNPDSYTASNVCGRVKLIEYNGEKFHGNWEVEVAKWLDKYDVKWNRQVEPFKYFWNGSWRLYFPDFYLPEFDLYIEVKGYETERDRCKWAVVNNLKIIKKEEINLIKKDQLPPVAQW